MSQDKKCTCGIRLASECDEEWGPECDLGNNPEFVTVFDQNDSKLAKLLKTFENAPEEIDYCGKGQNEK